MMGQHFQSYKTQQNAQAHRQKTKQAHQIRQEKEQGSKAHDRKYIRKEDNIGVF